MASQDRNSELINLSSGDFVTRHDAARAVANVHSFVVSSAILLRGFWPFTAFNNGNEVVDFGGGDYHLTLGAGSNLGTINVGAMGVTGGAAGNFYRPAATSPGLNFGARNITMGGWFYNSVLTANQGLMGRYDAAIAARQYAAFWNTNTIVFAVSGNGAANVVTSYASVPIQTWVCLIFKYITSTSIEIFLNGVRVAINSVGVPAALYTAGVVPFTIGSVSPNPTNVFQGNPAYSFIAGAGLSDQWIRAYYELSRPIFGV